MAKRSNDNKIPPLHSLYINPTQYCNLCCKHCWTSPTFTRKKQKYSVDLALIKKAISQGKKLGLGSVKLTGGEPFLCSDVLKILDYAKNSGLYAHAETNGTLIDKKTASLLAKIKADHISVSLDSTSSSLHDEFRGLKGSFNMALDGLKNIIAAGIPNQIIFSLTKKNSRELFKMPDFARSLGAGSLKINVISPIARADKMQKDGELLSTEENIDIYRKFESSFLTDKNAGIDICYDMPLAFIDLKLLKTHRKFSRCSIHNILGILPDGRISICGIGFVTKETVIGDLKKNSLKNIWQKSSFLKKLREDIPKNLKGVCSGCFFRDFCLGKCVALTLYRHKKHDLSFDFCQSAYNEGLFPRSRTSLEPWEL